MFAANYLVFRNSVAELYDQASNNNNLVVESAIQRFDDNFRELNNLMYSIHMIPYESLDTADGHETDMVSAYMLQKQINVLVSSASLAYLVDVVVFFQGHDLAVTSSGTISLQELFRQKYKHDLYTADYWKSYAAKRHSLKVFPESMYVKQASQYRSDPQKLLVILGNNNSSNKNVMLFVDVELLLQHVLKTMASEASLIIMDQDRNVLMNTGAEWNLVQILDGFGSKQGEQMTLNSRGDEYNLYQSRYNGFYYISKFPLSFRSVESIIRANHVIMLLAIVCAVLLAVALSVYLFKPVLRLSRLIGGEPGKRAGYQAIHSGIIQIQQENEIYKTSIRDIQSESRRTIWAAALDEHADPDAMERGMQQFPYEFWKASYFVMVCIRMIARDKGQASPSQQAEDIRVLIEAELKDKLDHAAVLHMNNLEFLVMAAVRKKLEKPKVAQAVRGFIRRMGQGGLRHYAALAAISPVYVPNLAHYRAAYQNVKDSLLYRNVNSKQVVFDPLVVDFEDIRFSGKVHFPLDEIDRLSNSLIGGNPQAAIKILGGIVDENVRLQINFHQLTHIAKCMFYQIVQHVDGSKAKQPTLGQLEVEFCRQVDEALHHEEIREALVRVLDYAAEATARTSRSKLNPEFITQYIEAHYMRDLYQDHMAEIFNTTPKYFSNYFKKTFQVNYVDYLNKVRISHAKKLLKNSNMSVAEIGKMVGYANNSTFVSTFKKYSDISPGEFRRG